MKLDRLNSHDFNMEQATAEEQNLAVRPDQLKNFSNTGGFNLQSKSKLAGGARIKVAVRIRPLLQGEVN